MSRRPTMPESVAVTLMVANRHTCGFCRVERKHVIIHHSDADPSNNDPATYKGFDARIAHLQHIPYHVAQRGNGRELAGHQPMEAPSGSGRVSAIHRTKCPH